MDRKKVFLIIFIISLICICFFLVKTNTYKNNKTSETSKIETKEETPVIESTIEENKEQTKEQTIEQTNTNNTNKTDNKVTNPKTNTKNTTSTKTKTKKSTSSKNTTNKKTNTNKNTKTNTNTSSSSGTTTNTGSNNNNQTETTKPKVTYSCPNGYKLNGTTCTITIDAKHVCPSNTNDYSNSEIPRDTYCVNLSEGYETTDESCPSGYGIIKIISLGGPDSYKCLPLHKKIYTCDSGYTLSNNKCTKTIPATKN